MRDLWLKIAMSLEYIKNIPINRHKRWNNKWQYCRQDMIKSKLRKAHDLRLVTIIIILWIFFPNSLSIFSLYL